MINLKLHYVNANHSPYFPVTDATVSRNNIFDINKNIVAPIFLLLCDGIIQIYPFILDIIISTEI